MKERIKEFAEQATEPPVFPATIGYFNREKFAELIVQECVNVLHDNELWNRHISHALKEHFGVE